MVNKSRGRGRAPQGALEVYEGEQLEERDCQVEGEDRLGEDGGMGAGGGEDGKGGLGEVGKGGERGLGSVSGEAPGVI